MNRLIIFLLLIMQLLSNCYAADININDINDFKKIKSKSNDSASIFKKYRFYLSQSTIYNYCNDFNGTLNLDKKNVITKQVFGFEYRINIELSYFFKNLNGIASELSFRDCYIKKKKNGDQYYNNDFLYVNESIHYQSLLLPFKFVHIKNFKSGFGGLIIQYGLNLEFPLLLSYNIDYKEYNSNENYKINNRVNMPKINPMFGGEFSLGYFSNYKNLNYFILSSLNFIQIGTENNSYIEELILSSFGVKIGLLFTIKSLM